ncbi:MAG: hypothetical protein RI925_600 [Pseudomonadota bacterium]|jgi:ribosomal protein S12 methylthiotransferase accessory factor
MMDWFNLIPSWHPRYQAVLEPHGVTLFDDGGLLHFEQPLVCRVAELIELAQPLAEICANPSWLAELPALLSTLAQMAGQGWICATQARPTGWLTPDFKLSPRGLHLSPLLELVVLTRLLDETELCHWVTSVAWPISPLRLVVCDDYFDPRLPTLHAECQAAGVAWLPLRISGDALWFGPYFDYQPGHACWHCLDARLARNQPVRAHWRNLNSSQHQGVPLSANADAARMRLRTLTTYLAQPLTEWPLLTVHADDKVCVHPSPQRPQCSACGNPDWLAMHQHQPLRVHPARKLLGVAGGARTQTSHETVTRLIAEVSPVSGVVADLCALPSLGDMSVYHSQFFRPLVSGLDSLTRVVAQSCLGKGASDAQSQASALCEAIERYAAGYQGDEAVVMGRAHSLSTLCVLPQSLLFFSAEQRAQARPGERAAHLLCEDDTLMAWSPAWSLTHHSARLLPLAACYADVPAPWSDYASWSSNGCASGNCREEAILQGLLEVVERDAVAIWWYNALPRPAYPSQHAGPAWLRTTQALGSDWDSWMLDLTHDMGIPVVAAIARHTTSGNWALGFGCSLEPTLAAERALTELIQLVAANKCLPAHWRDADAARVAFLHPAPPPASPPAWPAAHADIAEDIHTCVQALQRCGLEVLVHDYSRPDIPLHTVKVVVPGACHIWPERANPRLYQVPVALGWRDTPIAADALNPWDLYV